MALPTDKVSLDSLARMLMKPVKPIVGEMTEFSKAMATYTPPSAETHLWRSIGEAMGRDEVTFSREYMTEPFSASAETSGVSAEELRRQIEEVQELVMAAPSPKRRDYPVFDLLKPEPGGMKLGELSMFAGGRRSGKSMMAEHLREETERQNKLPKPDGWGDYE